MYVSLWILIPIILFAIAQTLNGLALGKQLDVARMRYHDLRQKNEELQDKVYSLSDDHVSPPS